MVKPWVSVILSCWIKSRKMGITATEDRKLEAQARGEREEIFERWLLFLPTYSQYLSNRYIKCTTDPVQACHFISVLADSVVSDSCHREHPYLTWKLNMFLKIFCTRCQSHTAPSRSGQHSMYQQACWCFCKDYNTFRHLNCICQDIVFLWFVFFLPSGDFSQYFSSVQLQLFIPTPPVLIKLSCLKFSHQTLYF